MIKASEHKSILIFGKEKRLIDAISDVVHNNNAKILSKIDRNESRSMFSLVDNVSIHLISGNFSEIIDLSNYSVSINIIDEPFLFTSIGNEGLRSSVDEKKYDISLFDHIIFTHEISEKLNKILENALSEPINGLDGFRFDYARVWSSANNPAEIVNKACHAEDKEVRPSSDEYFQAMDHVIASSNVLRGERPIVAFSSPIFPQEYGVPVYSLKIAAEISKYARLDLFNDVPPRAADMRFFNCVIDEIPDKSLDNYDARLFVMGNNSSLHRMPIALAQHARNGVCIYHDPQMLDVLNHAIGADGCARRAAQIMAEPVTAQHVEGWLSQRDTLPIPILPDVSKNLTGVVHSPIQQVVQALHYPGRDVVYLPHAIQHVVAESNITIAGRAAARSSLGIAHDHTVIASCGAVNIAKRSDEAIFALCHLHDWGLKAHLYFVGAIENNSDEPLRNIAESLDLDDYVHFSGRINEDVYMRYLVAADCGVQLRLTLFGQLSGAVIDCVAAALPVVAPVSLLTAIEAPAFAKALPDIFTSIDVAQALEDVLQSGRSAVDIEEWRSFVDAHSFERYGRRLKNLLGI